MYNFKIARNSLKTLMVIIIFIISELVQTRGLYPRINLILNYTYCDAHVFTNVQADSNQCNRIVNCRRYIIHIYTCVYIVVSLDQ